MEMPNNLLAKDGTARTKQLTTFFIANFLRQFATQFQPREIARLSEILQGSTHVSSCSSESSISGSGSSSFSRAAFCCCCFFCFAACKINQIYRYQVCPDLQPSLSTMIRRHVNYHNNAPQEMKKCFTDTDTDTHTCDNDTHLLECLHFRLQCFVFLLLRFAGLRFLQLLILLFADLGCCAFLSLFSLVAACSLGSLGFRLPSVLHLIHQRLQVQRLILVYALQSHRALQRRFGTVQSNQLYRRSRGGLRIKVNRRGGGGGLVFALHLSTCEKGRRVKHQGIQKIPRLIWNKFGSPHLSLAFLSFPSLLSGLRFSSLQLWDW